MTLHLEGQIVTSSHDPMARVYCYTAQHGGRRWTVEIKDDDLAGLNKVQRRTMVAARVTQAMRGPPDDV